MNQDTEKTKVIFKRFEGDTIALFPSLAGDSNPYLSCLSYQHVGQHGSATTYLSDLEPASPEEYASLKAELESLGYSLRICKRFTRNDLQARKEQTQENPVAL